MKVPNEYRLKDPFNYPVSKMGNNGWFLIPLSKSVDAVCIASDGEGWEHVSVTIRDEKKKIKRTPTWAEMCKIKDIFWSEDETVIQYHPPKSEYVNNHKHCLHLWKPMGYEIPLPPTELIGIK